MTRAEPTPSTELDSIDRTCLDFANTVDWHASPHPVEKLHSYEDIVVWTAGAGLVGPDEQDRLLAAAARRSTEAEAVFARAIALREAIYRVFSAVAKGGAADAADLATLNAELAAALPNLQIRPASLGYSWGWKPAGEALDALLWPVVRSAAELLTSPVLDRVRECADDRGCGFLFFDTTRNRSRRWCDMQGCGNRAKAKRHYARQRS